jgi:hypothetical protein
LPGRPGTSSEVLRLGSSFTASSPSSAAALRAAILSASNARAASSASVSSGIVSREDIEGLRERMEVGVLGMEEELKE